MIETYPQHGAERDRWVLSRRPGRNALDPTRPYAFFVEDERDAEGNIVPVATIFLTNSECPWKCVMCDLWRNTLTEPVPIGAIPAQIEHALDRLPRSEHVKLYNSGSFFDPRAVAPEEDKPIARRLTGFRRVIVECHPALITERCLKFRDELRAPLEVAMGLETAHPTVLEKLNKRMTLEQFQRAAQFLRRNGIALRVFLLVHPPFMWAEEAAHWAARSIEFAFDCGATAVSLIPTRGGNGAMEALAAAGEFVEPTLAALEAAAEHGVGLARGRVFADLWDLERFSACPHCFELRRQRLRRMNLEQTTLPPVKCPVCEGSGGGGL